MNSYKLVFCCTSSNAIQLNKNMDTYIRMIDPYKIVIIARNDCRSYFKDNPFIEFIDEDTLLFGLTYEEVRQYIGAKDINAISRTGWYFQQFLKLAYSYICQEDYYLVWDSDTLPLHLIDMFYEGKPTFDVKNEYNKAYFVTINNLFKGMGKEDNYSFISEHMLFKKSIVKNMLNDIEQVFDKDFWKAIIDCIPTEYIRYSGFSEFETYGTYVINRFKDEYSIKKWKSFREASIFFPDWTDIDKINELKLGFDAVSFEKHEMYLKLSKIFGNDFFRKRVFILFFLRVKSALKGY